MRLGRLIAAVAAAVVLATTAAEAQTCYDAVSDGTGPSRDAAMRDGFERALRGIDPAAAQAWRARGMRIGEVAGYTVRKLTSKCSPGGAGTICRIELTLCR